MNYDKEALINQVKSEIENCGSWYIDWGEASDIYKNCPTREDAAEIAAILESKGYAVITDRMGYGSDRVAPGNPICYRIYKGTEP